MHFCVISECLLKSSIFAMTVDVLAVRDLNTFLSGGTVHSESVQLSITQ